MIDVNDAQFCLLAMIIIIWNVASTWVVISDINKKLDEIRSSLSRVKT